MLDLKNSGDFEKALLEIASDQYEEELLKSFKKHLITGK